MFLSSMCQLLDAMKFHLEAFGLQLYPFLSAGDNFLSAIIDYMLCYSLLIIQTSCRISPTSPTTLCPGVSPLLECSQGRSCCSSPFWFEILYNMVWLVTILFPFWFEICYNMVLLVTILFLRSARATWPTSPFAWWQ